MSCHHPRVDRRFTVTAPLWLGVSLLLGLPAWSADAPVVKSKPPHANASMTPVEPQVTVQSLIPASTNPAQPRVVNTPGLYLSSQGSEAAAPRTITTDALYLSSSASADARASVAGAVITTDALYLSSSGAADSGSSVRTATITTDALYLNAKPSSGKR